MESFFHAEQKVKKKKLVVAEKSTYTNGVVWIPNSLFSTHNFLMQIGVNVASKPSPEGLSTTKTSSKRGSMQVAKANDWPKP